MPRFLDVSFRRAAGYGRSGEANDLRNEITMRDGELSVRPPMQGLHLLDQSTQRTAGRVTQNPPRTVPSPGREPVVPQKAAGALVVLDSARGWLRGR